MMSLYCWPFAEELDSYKRIFLAGAGGGYDIYSGLPLYFMLKERGKEVFLGNLSFAPLPQQLERQVSPGCSVVDADFEDYEYYCPEYRLARWFRERHQEEVEIFCFAQTGVVQLSAAYQTLVQKLDLDAIVLVDGGTDSLMRGDEFGLGTPQEDIASIAAVMNSGVGASYLAAIGFGVDAYHGVCHAQFLEAVSDLTEKGKFLGVSTVLPDSHGAKEFFSAVDYANEQMRRMESIVQNSLYSSIKGKFGDHHRTKRTSGSKLWMNPLMPMYWGFELAGIAERNLYLDRIQGTESMAELSQSIRMFKEQIGRRGWDHIPS